ncbi:Hypothetical predicted protein [Mytilus galloprovincialis]|uniref:SSD domain-containing protein n=1 Tax=Mytilus galloprovincialis TaxID=29158 RepID=A0A8B6HIC3_MYTGA|nr:Hypothetical predicted protein [Mytilus galloprovincialis]
MPRFYKLHQAIDNKLGDLFERYGRFIARHPWKIVIIVCIINAGSGIGIMELKQESGIDQYVPTGTTAKKDQTMVNTLFTINTSVNFNIQSLSDLGQYGEVIIEMKNGGSILNYSNWKHLKDLYAFINNISIEDTSGSILLYPDLCARADSKCVVGGSFVFEHKFILDLNTSKITYPTYNVSTGHTILLDKFIGDVKTEGGFISHASSIKFRFNLQGESFDLSRKWEEKFVERMSSFSNAYITVKYSHSDSLSEELSKNISGDISVFSVTFTLMIVFACFALMGTNCVDNRYFLGLAGVLSTCLAILAAFGVVSLCGAKLVDIVGIMPFLILGIGVDDMFILLSCLAATNCNEDVEIRIGKALKSGGTAITITSLTDIIAFCAGAASVFPSVRYFSWYTGCAVLFCYLNYVTLYIGIMTINEQRVSKKLHWFTCCNTISKESLEAEGKSKAWIMCCGGAPRTTREEVEGPVEKYPKLLIKKIVSNTPAKVIITLLFVVYLALSSWRASRFREDLDLRNLVSEDSYYHKFYDTNINHFSQGFFVSFNVRLEIDYRSEFIVENIDSVLKKAKEDEEIFNHFQLYWLDSYIKSPQFDNTTLTNFTLGLRKFLNTTYGTIFINDILINGNSIIASRFHIHSRSLIKSSDQASLMIRLRNIAKSSPLPIFVFSPNFIFYEQYVQIVPQTIQTLAIAVFVVFLVTAVFMPLPVLILLVTISVSMIMLGVIGLMEIWGLTLSSVTMIHIVMCVGFSVDFSAHICHAFAHVTGENKDARISTALDLAGGPILNGALSSVIGIVVLAFSKSYIFFSFFKVMFIVVVVGAMHAIFLLPVLLSWIGPVYGTPETDPVNDKMKYSETDEEKQNELMNYKENTIPRLSTASLRSLNKAS